MKKFASRIAVLLIALGLSLATISPAAAIEDVFRPFEGVDEETIESVEVGWTLEMSTVTFLKSGGVSLTFDVIGNPPPKISTFAYAGWNGAYPMYCGFNSNRGILVCKIESGINKHAGTGAYFELWGQPFTIYVPEKESEEPTQQDSDQCSECDSPQ